MQVQAAEMYVYETKEQHRKNGVPLSECFKHIARPEGLKENQGQWDLRMGNC